MALGHAKDLPRFFGCGAFAAGSAGGLLDEADGDGGVGLAAEKRSGSGEGFGEIVGGRLGGSE